MTGTETSRGRRRRTLDLIAALARPVAGRYGVAGGATTALRRPEDPD